MCVHPIHITSKNLINHIGAYSSLDVPCGKCYQCQDAKRSGILIRAYYEHKDSVYSFFDTLTYNDENLPVLCGYQLFRRRDVQLFLKRLRIKIQRWLKKEKGVECVSPFTFIVAGEYGGLRGRPHYHILFHVKCKELDVHTLKRFINETWQKGFTDSVHNTDKHIVNGLPALQYVVKYVCKDSVSRMKMDLAINAYKDSLTSLDGVDDAVHELRKTYGCFWQCSRYYGLSLLNEIDFEDLKQRVCRFYDGKNIVHLVSLPRYYVNKVFKRFVDFDKDSKILLDSPFAKENYAYVVGRMVAHTALRYKDAATNIGLPVERAYDAALYRIIYQGRYFVDLPEHPLDKTSAIEYLVQSSFTEQVMQDIISGVISYPLLRVVYDFEHPDFVGLDRYVDRCEMYLHRFDICKKVSEDYKDACTQRIKHLFNS